MANGTDARHDPASDLGRFVLLYFSLYIGMGAASPFLPAFLASRGLSPEQIGLVVALGIVVRLLAGPLAGSLADRLQARRNVLTACLLGSAVLALCFVPARGFWLLLAISLMHAALLVPTTSLADALALRSATPERTAPVRFEYGWVRGTGSAAFIIGSLVAGQAIVTFGLAAALVAQALLLVGAVMAAAFAPETRSHRPIVAQAPSGLATLLQNRAFRRLVLVSAIVLGSHAMHDTFAMIAWNAAGISAAVGSMLWSGSVLAEVVVFFLLGPRLLQTISPPTAMTIAALAAALRWIVLGQSSSVFALALVEPLHGLTFALLHLACMRVLVRITPVALAATAQAVYAFGAAASGAVLTFASGYLYAEFGAAGFLVMAALAVAALPAIWALSRSLPPTANKPPDPVH